MHVRTWLIAEAGVRLHGLDEGQQVLGLSERARTSVDVDVLSWPGAIKSKRKGGHSFRAQRNE